MWYLIISTQGTNLGEIWEKMSKKKRDFNLKIQGPSLLSSPTIELKKKNCMGGLTFKALESCFAKFSQILKWKEFLSSSIFATNLLNIL